MTFRPSLWVRALTALFFLACAGVLGYTVVGLTHAEGDAYVMLFTVAIIPLLITGVAGMRAAALLTRRITVEADALDHRQWLKNHRIPFKGVRRIEFQRRADEEIGTLRILWSGGPRIYLDASSVEGWPELLALLEQRVGRPRFVEVEGFEPVED